ncbi:MAG: hypothetical protein PVJ09_03650 [Candidatus Woesebacteria bacterium]|jgi:hypothetical protein
MSPVRPTLSSSNLKTLYYLALNCCKGQNQRPSLFEYKQDQSSFERVMIAINKAKRKNSYFKNYANAMMKE